MQRGEDHHRRCNQIYLGTFFLRGRSQALEAILARGKHVIHFCRTGPLLLHRHSVVCFVVLAYLSSRPEQSVASIAHAMHNV